MQVSTAELSEILGVTDRHIQRLETQGVLRKTDYGEWDLATCVQAFVAHRTREQPRHTPARGKAGERLKAAKAGREELKLALETGEVIFTSTAIEIIDEVLGIFRSGLAGVPARITRDMTLRGKIETEHDALLCAVANKFEERAAALEAVSAPDPAPA